ncbi:hypothetical protein L4G92_02475 [Neisseria sp. ZJ106]|uniref:Periplasmic protein n=1 Tax=Neisseria lisongii TaxID=2912188 RepID=A0AAW5AKF9_9NEIS|nr:hypothetical protein [Neisseria lisongii]MCF7520919.1 hypothetical protein [Neisseria lisongii]MCF7528951.1 hypothetical protein [Neisseria lisongii]WCL72478.1 hypothetical protein PJU73_08040 [Neisseria lisongii]
MNPKPNRLIKTAVLLLTLAAAFYAGMVFQNHLYEDTCLDLGGGKNPGNFPICVINQNTPSERP